MRQTEDTLPPLHILLKRGRFAVDAIKIENIREIVPSNHDFGSSFIYFSGGAPSPERVICADVTTNAYGETLDKPIPVHLVYNIDTSTIEVHTNQVQRTCLFASKVGHIPSVHLKGGQYACVAAC